MAPVLWEYTADTPTLSKIIHFFATNFILKRTFTFHCTAHCFLLFLRNFPLQMKNLMLTEMERFVDKPLDCG